MISFEFPLKTISRANSTEHWSSRMRRVKNERTVTMVEWLANVKKRPSIPCTVTLTRIAPRALDSDNLTMSVKGPRDQIAAMMGIDDRDARVTWCYKQERGAPRFYGVRVEIEETVSGKNWRHRNGSAAGR